MNQRTRVLLAAGIGFAITVGTGCSRVTAYQRGKLAHPTMLLGETAGAAQAHVYAIQEGAIGGGSGAQGGCGCN